MFKSLPIAAIVVAAAALAVPADAGATIVQNAAGACAGARSNYTASLRFRPTGVNNEGTADAFVSCSMNTSDYYQSANDVNGVVLSNRGTVDKTVSCTLAAGSFENQPSLLFPKAITVPVGVPYVILSWDPDIDNAGMLFSNSINYSCVLPPGIDLQTVFTNAIALPPPTGAP